MSRILVAGIGNIFKGDDAFGVEVVRRLAARTLPSAVKLVDIGIRGIDLTYALLDGYDAAILVDTAKRGETPGTVTIVEPERPAPEELVPEDLVLEPHNLDPAKVLRVVSALGGGCPRVLLVACEPETFGDEETGAMGLSLAVSTAVDKATDTVEQLAGELIAQAVSQSTVREQVTSGTSGGL